MTHLGSSLCLSGCGKDEISNYLYVVCDFFGNTWKKILKWLGGHSILFIDAHGFQFCSKYLFSKAFGRFLQTILVACCGIIWKERNNRVFNQKEMTIVFLFNKVKILVW